MPTPRKGTGSPAGSYLVQQHLKEARGSPTAPASPATETAALRLELQRLQQHNHALKRRLVGAGMEVEVAKLVNEDAGNDGAVLVTAMSTPGQPLHDALSPQELEEAALRCCWMAHYWEVAQQLGIYAEVARDRADYWRALAPSEEAFHMIVQRTVASILKPAFAKSMGASQQQQADTEAPGQQQTATQRAAVQQQVLQVSAADVVEVERGMRQVAELGLVQEVRCSLTWAAESRRRQHMATCMEASVEQASEALRMCLQAHDPEDPSLPLPEVPVQSSGHDTTDSQGNCPMFTLPLSALECREIRFQAAWLAYLWARAAAADVEPHVALLRVEQWGRFLDRQRFHVRHWSELAAAQRELHLLGVEQQLWQQRAW